MAYASFNIFKAMSSSQMRDSMVYPKASPRVYYWIWRGFFRTSIPCIWYIRSIIPCIWYIRTSLPCMWYIRTSLPCMWYIRTSLSCMWYIRTSSPCMWYIRTSVPNLKTCFLRMEMGSIERIILKLYQ